VIGQAPSGGGTLTQSGRIDVVGNAGPETSSRLAIGQNLTVGERAIGLVKLADGGQVEVDGDLLVGAERNGVGRIEIEGQQAVEDPVPTVLKVGGAIALGRHGGQGVLVLKHGGQLSGPTLSPEKIELAEGADSVGRIELQDALLTSRDLVVGAGGEARVELKGASTLQSTGLVEVGGKAGSASGDGIVRISEDSRWLVTGAFQRGPLVIGNERPGDVVVSQHARLEAGAMRLGAADSARGALYVLDDAAIENKLRSGESVVVGYDSAGDNRVEFSGRSWTIAPVDGDAAELVIGRQGNGLVDVMKGKLSVGDARAANAPPENGLIRVGVDGRARLRIRQSGLLPAGVVEASAIAIGANDDAEVLLEGGRLSARQVTLEGGRSALRILAGGRASAGEVDSKGTVVLQGDDARLNVLGAMTIQGPEAEFRVLEGGGVDAERLRLKDVAQTEIAGSADEGEGVSTRQLQVEGSRLRVNHGGRLAAGQAAIGGASAAGRAQLAVQGGQVEVGDSLRVGFVQDFGSGIASSAPGDLVVRGGGGVAVGKQLFVGPLGHVDIADGRVAVGGLWGLEVPLGELHVGTGGSLRGCARVRASRVVVRSGGVAEPGCSPGTLAVDGDFVVEAGGTLQIELAGLTDGLHDLVDVLGNVVLGDGAQLDLRFLDGFAPQAGDVVDFLRATGDFSGNFADVRVSGLAAGWEYRIGSTVDGLLRLTSLSDAQPANIPEPATLVPALVALAGLTRHRRRSAPRHVTTE
jgi:hypothetical protein